MQIIKSSREAFATPVQAVSGIVGKQRQTLPILSNILIKKVGTRVEFTATDLDIEIKTFADIYSKSRLKSIALPRQIAMYLCKELTNSSLQEIGDRFGKRDHTTVIHAVKKITDLRNKDKDLNYKIHVLEQMLKN